MRWSAPAGLRFAIEADGGTCVLRLAGELDRDTVGVFGEALAEARAQGTGHVVLELSRLTFCGVAGVHAFYDAHRRCADEGIRLELRDAHSAVRRVLELAGIADLWVPADPPSPPDTAQERSAQLVGVMEAAMHAVGARMGTAQYFDHAGESLQLVAHRGFAYRFITFFETVRGYDTSCGAAAADLAPVYVEDVVTSPIFADSPELEVLVEAGVGSCASLPITGSGQELLGVVSTHRPRPGPWTAEDRSILRQVQAYASETAQARP